jgi:hypothetical protein
MFDEIHIHVISLVHKVSNIDPSLSGLIIPNHVTVVNLEVPFLSKKY